MKTLWNKITAAEKPLLKFIKGGMQTACIYAEPYLGESDVVRWFYSRNNGCQIFFACGTDVSARIDAESWADVNDDFTLFVEQTLMPYCVENTDWLKCSKYGIDYDKKIPKRKKQKGEEHYQFGCAGTSCYCEPFGQGDFTYGIAEESEFIL